eukprot:TRINITY_DN5128_c0_g2_i2.p1 TRINITY_DN5128_c0_g2~~TRINITY_DN5128_c0_g2_i2.p1  ORF type:complete len:314 (+),score=46.02 TRINITY_DN5128_c0_g2_i2:110-1051(+)
MSEDIMNLHLVEQSNTKVIVHPSVPIQILELFYRSSDQKTDQQKNESSQNQEQEWYSSQQIFGILLGNILPDQVRITNCYIIKNANFKSEDAPTYVKQLIEQNSKMYSKEEFLGIFFTYSKDLSKDLNNVHFEIHRKVTRSCFISSYILPSPIYLGIDPTMAQNSFNIKAYTYEDSLQLCSQLGLVSFKTLNLQVQFIQEKTSEIIPFMFHEKKNNQEFRLINIDSVKTLIQDTIKYLLLIQEKVKLIKEKKLPSDQKLGIALRQLLNLAPIATKEEYQKMTEQYKQDSQLLVFLNNLTKVHNNIQEKLASLL